MKRRATTLVCLAGLALVLFSANAATADVAGTATTAGVETRLTGVVLDRAKQGLDLQSGEPDKRVWEYTSVTTCANNVPGGPNADLPCLGAIQACAGNTPQQGQGPQIQLFRREVDAANVPMGGWQPIGTTCFPQLVPGKPVLGMGLILAAFHNTTWALPTVHIQPEGNVTLVTLPTYFEVRWPDQGFQPGEIDPVNLMGFQVRIRPTNEGYRYFFGDGITEQTDSSGGTYPDGDVTHAYPRGGKYDSRIDITYGGEFSVNGGQWLRIPATENVTIPGSTTVLTVSTAHAKLVSK